jgi:predicted  nucleic acid-binding Zn-ribbon protein
MNEPITHSPENARQNLDDLSASIKRISEKINVIQEAIKNMNHNRQQLEGKIEDAQKRVQRILSRLPDQGDTRQLNLLGEAIPPTNSEDDSEPTTH